MSAKLATHLIIIYARSFYSPLGHKLIAIKLKRVSKDFQETPELHCDNTGCLSIYLLTFIE